MLNLRSLPIVLLLAGCQAVPPTLAASLPTAAQEHVDFHQGVIHQSTEPTELAIDGKAFFVLSKADRPASLDDLVFTRDGGFHMQFVPGAEATGSYVLVNADGYKVMGYS